MDVFFDYELESNNNSETDNNVSYVDPERKLEALLKTNESKNVGFSSGRSEFMLQVNAKSVIKLDNLMVLYNFSMTIVLQLTTERCLEVDLFWRRT
ncbi:hypothetical protein V1477_019454 [Vespula maculifrons]|uniref:Uncharacterized protein n=1 Tax=Vespula maculifrons TaxID=7453 RepID=A0ABD2ASL3_VESMC